jgi:hypothetical protein
MDICRDCMWSRERGKFCANPVIITEFEEPGGARTPVSVLTEGVVKSAQIRAFAKPGIPEDACSGYSERPWASAENEPSTINPMRDALGVEESYYRAGFWLEAVVIAGLLATIWGMS